MTQVIDDQIILQYFDEIQLPSAASTNQSHFLFTKRNSSLNLKRCAVIAEALRAEGIQNIGICHAIDKPIKNKVHVFVGYATREATVAMADSFVSGKRVIWVRNIYPFQSTDLEENRASLAMTTMTNFPMDTSLFCYPSSTKTVYRTDITSKIVGDPLDDYLEQVKLQEDTTKTQVKAIASSESNKLLFANMAAILQHEDNIQMSVLSPSWDLDTNLLISEIANAKLIITDRSDLLPIASFYGTQAILCTNTELVLPETINVLKTDVISKSISAEDGYRFVVRKLSEVERTGVKTRKTSGRASNKIASFIKEISRRST